MSEGGTAGHEIDVRSRDQSSDTECPAARATALRHPDDCHLQIEDEATPENPLPGMKEPVAYLKRVLAAF